MEKPPISKKQLIGIALFSLTIVVFSFLASFFSSNSKIVFCDVGQGDGVYIRLISGYDIVIDAGPNRKIQECLGKHMPFYDREIELAILTHPQKDHYYGFLSIIDRYKINTFVLNKIVTPAVTYQNLLKKIEEKNISILSPTAGQRFYLPGGRIYFYWPSQPFLQANISNFHLTSHSTNSKAFLFGESKRDPNDFSYVFLLETQGSRALFTGDATSYVLQMLLQQQNLKTDILKIPHHGSKHGLNREFLELADPKVSVISVGIKNSYGHPSREVTSLLEASNRKYFRTDREGDIVVTINRRSQFTVHGSQ